MSHGIPEPLLSIRVQDAARSPSLLAMCAGYESGQWRARMLAKHMMEWLPDFTLSLADLQDSDSGTWVRMLRRAAMLVYKSEKFKNRGEFGELLLHLIVRQVFGSLPAISKIRYKSSRNETVKGFDAVHVVGPPDKMELWLGEAKLYSDFKKAAADVTLELQAHTNTEFLRDEFLLIRGKIDPDLPHAAKLARLLDENVSLDEIFEKAAIPVLLTYDSECLASHSACTAEYTAAFEKEVVKVWDYFVDRPLPTRVVVHLILVPLATKEALVTLLDGELKAWQKI